MKGTVECVVREAVNVNGHDLKEFLEAVHARVINSGKPAWIFGENVDLLDCLHQILKKVYIPTRFTSTSRA